MLLLLHRVSLRLIMINEHLKVFKYFIMYVKILKVKIQLQKFPSRLHISLPIRDYINLLSIREYAEEIIVKMKQQ